MKKVTDIRLLAALGDGMKDGLVIYDLSTANVIYCNQPAKQITGIRLNDSVEQIMRLWRTVMIQDRACLSEQYQRVSQQEGQAEAEFGIIGSDGGRLFVHASGTRIESFLVIFLRDITRVKEHEDYLVEFGAKKNTLLDTLTHNLSGSLNLTKNLMSEAAKHTTGASGELQTFLNLINSNTEASLKIIEDFLIYEHEKSPRIYSKFTRIDLVQKVGFIHEQLRYSYPDRRFQLLTDRGELHVTTDEVKLLQVINNLVSNAIKFSRADQAIMIEIDAKPEEVIIRVQDQGIGIPDKLKPYIFQPNTAAGRKGLAGEESNGQGLFICKNLIDLIGGDIWFTSEENKGSVFFIRLPYNHPRAEQTPEVKA